MHNKNIILFKTQFYKYISILMNNRARKSRLYVTSGVAQEDNKQTGARNLKVFEAKCFVLVQIVATRVFARRLVFSGVEQSV